jgi:methylmalonyl-CoA mutase cobalamin-binding subunit
MARIVFATFHNEFCIGVSYLKATLQDAGHRCRFVNLKVYSKDPVGAVPELPRYTEVHEVLEPTGWHYFSYPWQPTEKEWDLWLNLVLEEDPQLVGMSIAASHMRTAREAIRRLRAAGLDVPIIWGGPQATVDPESCLRVEGVDFVCIGEAELVITAIADAVDRNRPLKDLPNLAYYREDGALVKNPPAGTLKDLDQLPFPDFDEETRFFVESNRSYQGYLPPESTFNNSYMLFTARGCPYKCTFCINAVLHDIDPDGANLRRRTVPNVIAELKEVRRRFGDVYIHIEDEIFTLSKQWVRDFSQAFHDEIRLPFWCYTHPNCCPEEMILDLKYAGIRYIVMGLQSGSERLNREVYRRHTPIPRILDALRMLDRQEVVTYCDVLTNNPVETEADRRATAELLWEIPERANLGLGKVIVYPSSPLFEHVKDMPFPPPVDEALYEYWNPAYILAMYGGLSKSEFDALLIDGSLRRDPQTLWDQAYDVFKSAAKKNDQRLLEQETWFSSARPETLHVPAMV